MEQLQKSYTIDVRWVAFPLHPDTPPEGRTLEDLFAGSSVNVTEMVMRLKRVAAELGLPFGERTMTCNSRRAQELGKWAEDYGKGDAFHNAVFRAYFVQGQNIAMQDVLVNIAESVELSGEAALRIIKERTYKEAVDKDWSRSFRAAVTAVPTFMINGNALVGAQSYKSLEKFVVDST